MNCISKLSARQPTDPVIGRLVIKQWQTCWRQQQQKQQKCQECEDYIGAHMAEAATRMTYLML